MREVIDRIREAVSPLEVRAHRGLQAVGLRLNGAGGRPRSVLPLAAALEQGGARVTELGSGEVGRLRVENMLQGSFLFALVGELVAGGRQDRVINTSFIVPPGRVVQVPVSCVEERRWDHGGASFTFLPIAGFDIPDLDIAIGWYLSRHTSLLYCFDRTAS